MKYIQYMYNLVLKEKTKTAGKDIVPEKYLLGFKHFKLLVSICHYKFFRFGAKRNR